jgi:hypothetical protein
MNFAPRSRPFVDAATAEQLRAAIANVTRALARVSSSEHVLDLVRERADLRRELDAREADARPHPTSR